MVEGTPKAGKQATTPSWQSSLEDYPDHVKAIGMISIENANLENVMAALFSAACDIPLRLGLVIYLTPKSARARLDVFRKATKVALRQRGESEQRERLKKTFQRVDAIALRVEKLTGKRHDIIHDLCGIDADTGDVQRSPMAFRGEDVSIPLPSLTELVKQMRQLIDDASNLTHSITEHHPSMVSMHLTVPNRTPQ
jgi:hypothetical protein